MKRKCYLKASDLVNPKQIITEFKIHCEVLFGLKSSIENYIFQKEWNVPFVDPMKTIHFYGDVERAVECDVEMLENDYEELVERLCDDTNIDTSFDIDNNDQDIDIFDYGETPMWEEPIILPCDPKSYHILDFGESQICEIFDWGEGEYYCPSFQINRDSFPKGCIIADAMIEPIQSIVGFDLTIRNRSGWTIERAIIRSLV